MATPSFDGDDSAYLAELAEYVAIPSVSRDAAPEVMRRAADWLTARLAFANPRVMPTSGHPAVVGEWLGRPGGPTVLVYGHYDVQPTGDLAEWTSPPFELTRDGEVVRGRGVSDDKGPVYIMLQVAKAFMEQQGGLPLNVKFVLEGEEEIGSPHFPEFVTAHRRELAADLVISADGAMWRPGEPSISLGSKGLVAFDLEVTGARDDLHSGRYGGTVANPLHGLTELLARLHRPDGAVAVPGFYAGIPELSPERRGEIKAIPFDDDAYRAELGVAGLHGEPGYSTLERLWERPTLEINGVSGGGWYTVIPHLARAHLSCRLVPGQDPQAVLGAIRQFVQREAPPGLRVEMRPEPNGVRAYTLDPGHPAVGAAKAALESVYPGQPVIFAKIGGTLPATQLFEEVLGAKTLFFSFSTADEHLHAPNEFLRVNRLREGMRAWAELWQNLGQRLTARQRN